eukprot:TRINITY_DN62989_c0_g1_i1.p1 TRINITY_DN62989_c0_g1~~TRINITY_DN62989_c0_g1_i1.p1  ORF type:complete len:236 (+),score=24.22 TRINITY_DN62989_c0_g1_i1:108-815(+)
MSNSHRLSIPKKFLLCRLASRIHFELMVTPATVIRRMGKAVNLHVEDQANRRKVLGFIPANCAHMLANVIMCGFIVLLPWAYAEYGSENACEEESVLINDKINSFQKMGCEAEDNLRNMHTFPSNLVGGLLGLLSIALGFSCMVMMGILDQTLKSCRWFYVKRLMWKPLNIVWCTYVNLKCPNFKDFNHGNVIPGIFTLKSVMLTFTICWLDVGIVWGVSDAQCSNRWGAGICTE